MTALCSARVCRESRAEARLSRRDSGLRREPFFTGLRENQAIAAGVVRLQDSILKQSHEIVWRCCSQTRLYAHTTRHDCKK